jgi:dTDP-glucose pyrophosphorylase
MIVEFQNLLIDEFVSVKEAMKLLDKVGEKILFVINNTRQLVGSITDGDIRRWILKEGDLSANVNEVCNKSTYSVKPNYNIEEIKEIMLKRELVYVPVLDTNNEIIEFIIWDKIFDGKIKRKSYSKLNLPVVIMAGGQGTRLDPFTRIIPKPLIPIGDKTILEIIIDRFLEYQINQFYLSVNYKANIIKSYFEELKPEYKLEFINETKPLGTVGSLKSLEGKITGDIILTNCDILIEAMYNDLYSHHKKEKNQISIVASIKNFKIPYGICEISNGGCLVGIKEKPEFNFLVNTGMYIINSELLEFIPYNELFHVTDLIEKVKNLGLKVGIYPISENSWIDVGEIDEYKKALLKLV